MKKSTGKKLKTHGAMHIGMRKVKSLLAIVLGFLIWQFIRLFFPDLEIHPVFVYMYGFLEIRDSSEKTKTFGIERIKATLVAMAVVMPLLLVRILIHSNLDSKWLVTALDLVMLLFGALVTLQIGQKLGCESLSSLAAAIFIGLWMYNSDDNRYLYALLRAFQTVIGVFVAWLLNVVLFPYHGKESAEQKE